LEKRETLQKKKDRKQKFRKHWKMEKEVQRTDVRGKNTGKWKRNQG
jgi:hypothetical protein